MWDDWFAVSPYVNRVLFSKNEITRRKPYEKELHIASFGCVYSYCFIRHKFLSLLINFLSVK